jgi:hypothetical protein
LRARAQASLLVLLCSLCGGGSVLHADGATPDTTRAPQYFPPLERPPLDPPLRLSGSFGEYRSGHFHAGLDFSTGEQVGRPVYASMPGYVMRVRASGIGYGRSVYVQADEGRLLVYGHLDAFDEPLASRVDSMQAAGGQYEQDLWPDSTRFRVRAGQRLGWSGRSGTDAPHLHFEIRRGDVAYNPLLAGVSVEDTVAPVIRSFTLFPHGWGAEVDGRPGPVTKRVAGVPDTFAMNRYAGLLVQAEDARADGRPTMAPWRIRATAGPLWFECRFDSVSWAEGMSEVDYVYDRGLRAPRAPRSVLAWPAGSFRSRVQREGAPAGDVGSPLGFRRDEPTGTVVEGSKELQVEVEDASGNRATASLLLLPYESDDWYGEPAWWDSVALASVDSSWPGAAQRARRIASKPWSGHEQPGRGRLGVFEWNGTGHEGFDYDPVRFVLLHRVARSGELSGASDVLSMHPVLEPLHSPFRLSVRVAGTPDPRLGLYRDSGGGWEWIGAAYDSATRRVSAETRRFGRFALFRDAEAPRIELRAPPRAPPAGAYPAWALEARIVEQGSGVAARESYFLVDGHRVPSEWDAVLETLRWLPLRPPASGRHECEIVVADRAGNLRRRHGSFVLD